MTGGGVGAIILQIPVFPPLGHGGSLRSHLSFELIIEVKTVIHTIAQIPNLRNTRVMQVERSVSPSRGVYI